MNTVVLDIAEFRNRFPAFADSTKWTDATLLMYWDEVGCFIRDGGYGGILTGDCSVLAQEMLLAHFLQLSLQTQSTKSKQGGFKTSASIDKVSVAYLAPPTPDMFTWWLAKTAYGQQLAAFLEVKAVGGITVGGLPERTGFRKWGGVFF